MFGDSQIIAYTHAHVPLYKGDTKINAQRAISRLLERF